MVTIQIRRGSPSDPEATALAPGELAVDYGGGSRADLYVGNGAGTDNLRVNPLQLGRLLRRVKITTGTTTYTPGALCATAHIRMVGGGGGGGGSSSVVSQAGGAGGGGSGAFLDLLASVTAGTSYACAVGAAGTGAAAGFYTGNAGGNTTLTIGATTHTAAGGLGGNGVFPNATAFALGGVGGGTPSTGDIAFAGPNGGVGLTRNSSNAFSGWGANNPLGAGGAHRQSQGNGLAASGYGSGGSGGVSINNGGAAAGGDGAPGVILIDEYSEAGAV